MPDNTIQPPEAGVDGLHAIRIHRSAPAKAGAQDGGVLNYPELLPSQEHEAFGVLRQTSAGALWPPATPFRPQAYNPG